MTRNADDRFAIRAEQDQRLSAAMASAQDGDRVAYELVLRESMPIIRRIARHQGGPADTLDDVVQDVLVTIHGARASFDPSRSYVAWLTAITRRRTIDLLRKRSRRAGREVFSPVDFENHPGTDDPELAASRQGDAALLRSEVAGLPAGQREAVEELALQENSLEDASKHTGRAKTSLKVNLHRAIKTLRARMSGVER